MSGAGQLWMSVRRIALVMLLSSSLFYFCAIKRLQRGHLTPLPALHWYICWLRRFGRGPSFVVVVTWSSLFCVYMDSPPDIFKTWQIRYILALRVVLSLNRTSSEHFVVYLPELVPWSRNPVVYLVVLACQFWEARPHTWFNAWQQCPQYPYRILFQQDLISCELRNFCLQHYLKCMDDTDTTAQVRCDVHACRLACDFVDAAWSDAQCLFQGWQTIQHTTAPY